jgi:hypothetical protein
MQPKTFAASTYTTGTLLNPVYVLIMIGNTAPIKTTKPADWCVSPNHIIAKGIHASGGIGRNISITGSKT